MSANPEKLIDGYLKDLERELRGFPRNRRLELLAEVRDHIAQARTTLSSESDAEVKTMLERIGDPADIAAEARDRFEVRMVRPGALEFGALILLAIGGLVLPIIGWVIGVILLWISPAWTSGEKLLGTLVVPGGLAVPLFLGVFAVSPGLGPMESALFGVLFVAPVASLTYLAVKLRSRSAAATHYTASANW